MKTQAAEKFEGIKSGKQDCLGRVCAAVSCMFRCAGRGQRSASDIIPQGPPTIFICLFLYF